MESDSNYPPLTKPFIHAFIVKSSVQHLSSEKMLDVSILHEYGTNTVSKKGGDGIGYSGHKHQRGEKVVAIVDNNGYILAPYTIAPVNKNDCILLPDSLSNLSHIAKPVQSVFQ